MALVSCSLCVLIFQFILEADFDLIEHIFRGLEDLLWKSPMRLSSCTVVGQLLTNGSDLHHYCGHVLSPRALEEAVAEALTASTIGLFASLCCFVIPSLRCYRSDVRGHRVPVTVGPDIPAARTVHQDSLSAERLSIVDDFTRDLQKLWAVFEATPTSAKSNAFSSIVKQWMLMKQKFNIQSENNQLARDIDAALLEAYEALHRNGAFEAPFGATLIPMVRDCLAGQLHEVPCTRDRPVLTSMPARLRQLILSDLWPLLVLSEAFGVQRLFSALSYVMLQQLRQSATVEMEKNKSACSDLSAGELQLLSSLATHEGDLDTSLSADSEEAAENGAKDSAQDISIEHSRRSAPPVPISHPAVLLRESVSMFDDDEDGNKSLLCESLSVKAVPSRSILSDWSLCRHKSEIHQSSETDILQQAVKSVYLCTEKSNFTRHSIALVTPTKGQVETPTSANKADRCTPEIEAQRRALSRLREHRRGASRSPRPVRPSVQDRLAAVRCEAAIARTRSSSPAAHKRRPASPAPGVSKVLFSPQPNASSRQNKDGFLKGTPTIVSALSSVKLWGSPDAATDGDSHPHTPTTVVDIDETISRVHP